MLGLSAAVWFRETLLLAAWYAVGKSPHCTLARALGSVAHERELVQTKDRILAASRLVRKDEHDFRLWETPFGPFWIPPGHDYMLPYNLAELENGIYRSEEVDIRPGDVVLDCGANVGAFTREALKRGARQVIAIEPAPENLECLRRNLAAEIDQGRVVVYAKGVWDKEDTLTLYVNPANPGADSFVWQAKGSQAVVDVPLTTIDRLVAELNLERVDFIKMDIEGAELKALEGARATLARFRPRLALSSYHEADHPKLIPEAVRRGWDGYRGVCGPCAKTETVIRPDVILFR